MNMNVKLTGMMEKIMTTAVQEGLAKTKTDAIMLGLLELDHRYKLLEKLEDEEDVRESDGILGEIKQGKQKTYNAKEFKEKTGIEI